MSQDDGGAPNNNDNEYFEDENLAFLPADHVLYFPPKSHLLALTRQIAKCPSQDSRRGTRKSPSLPQGKGGPR